MGVEIVTLPPEQWPAYKALRLESLKNDPQAFGMTYEAAAAQPDAYFRGRLEDSQQGEKSWLLFAREDGNLIGVIGAFRTEEPGVAKIVSVSVSPAARGRGISKRLMAAILEKLVQAGVHRVLLGVTAGQDAAIGLYKSFGFETVATHTKTMGDGIVHEGYEMEREI